MPGRFTSAGRAPRQSERATKSGQMAQADL